MPRCQPSSGHHQSTVLPTSAAPRLPGGAASTVKPVGGIGGGATAGRRRRRCSGSGTGARAGCVGAASVLHETGWRGASVLRGRGVGRRASGACERSVLRGSGSASVRGVSCLLAEAIVVNAPIRTHLRCRCVGDGNYRCT